MIPHRVRLPRHAPTGPATPDADTVVVSADFEGICSELRDLGLTDIWDCLLRVELLAGVRFGNFRFANDAVVGAGPVGQM